MNPLASPRNAGWVSQDEWEKEAKAAREKEEAEHEAKFPFRQVREDGVLYEVVTVKCNVAEELRGMSKMVGGALVILVALLCTGHFIFAIPVALFLVVWLPMALWMLVTQGFTRLADAGVPGARWVADALTPAPQEVRVPIETPMEYIQRMNKLVELRK